MAQNIASTVLYRTLGVCFFLIPLVAPSISAADDWKYEETRRDARDFVSGGSIHVRMTVGDLHIRRGDSNQIRLEYIR
jgi:hypothetical protein